MKGNDVASSAHYCTHVLDRTARWLFPPCLNKAHHPAAGDTERTDFRAGHDAGRLRSIQTWPANGAKFQGASEEASGHEFKIHLRVA
jgi:hypothetical protein